MSSYRWGLVAGLLLIPRLVWAEPAAVQLYEKGEYQTAVHAFEVILARSQQSAETRGLTLTYLAAALHVLGRVEEARKHLVVLAREHPEHRVDTVRFLPELVALAEAIRLQVKAEQNLAARTAELEQLMQQDRLHHPQPALPTHWRPEVFAFYEAIDSDWTIGAGLGYQWRSLEGTARLLLGEAMAFHLQGGVLLRRGDLLPLLGARTSFVPGLASYGAGPVVGVRYALPGHLVVLVDVGGEYFFKGRDDRYRFALTAHMGLGFDVHVP